MPVKDIPQALVKDDDISTEPGVLTLNSEVAAGVEDWLVAPNSTMEDQTVSITTVADNKAAINTDSVEGEATAVVDLLEDNHEDEFLATTSSHPSDNSLDAAESEEEVEDEILESVSAVLLKIKNNFNSLTLSLF